MVGLVAEIPPADHLTRAGLMQSREWSSHRLMRAGQWSSHRLMGAGLIQSLAGLTQGLAGLI